MNTLPSVRLGILLAFAVSACAQRKTLGDVSFSVPNGYQYEFAPGDDHATVGFKNGNAYCVLVIYDCVRSFGDPDTNFKATWRQLLGKSAPGLPAPIYDLRPQTGNPGRQSGYPGADGKTNFWLFTLETGRDFIPVVVLTSGRPMFDSQQTAIMQFVKDVRSSRTNVPPANTQSQNAPPANPRPASAPPANNQAGGKTNISMADLVGEWRRPSERYTIAAGGRYDHGFTGYSGTHIVREQSVGVLELGGEFLVFRDEPGPRKQRYRFISYQAAPDGSTVLTLLAEQHPVNTSNINLYAEKWTRARQNGR